MNEPRSIKALREALLKLGLSDDEVQRFLTILRSDLMDSNPDENTIQRICEEFARTLPEIDGRFGGASLISWRMAQFITGGIALGILGNLLTDLIKVGLEELTSNQSKPMGELAFAGGLILEKKPTGMTGLPYTVAGLRKLRKSLRVTANRAARECSMDPKTYARAERGRPISEPDAKRIKAGMAYLMTRRGVFLD